LAGERFQKDKREERDKAKQMKLYLTIPLLPSRSSLILPV